MALFALGWTTAGSAEVSKAQRARLVGSAGGLSSLFMTDDYPREALLTGAQGMSMVEITITPAGRVGKCVVVVSSGTASLDQRTCAIFTERARFFPARDARGRPTSDTDRHSIRWALPLDEFADDNVTTVVTLERGTAGECRNEPARAVLRGCDIARSFVKAMTTRFGDIPARELVIEYGNRTGSGSELELMGAGPGLRRSLLVALTLTIAADGRITDCSPTAGLEGNQARADDCPPTSRRKFDPQPSGVSALRYLTNYKMLYLRGVSTSPQVTNFARIFAPDDYPADALAQSREGIVAAEVTVEADGRATACTVKKSSGTASLDAVTCAKLMSAGRYEAARDTQQRAVGGKMIKGVKWALPRAPLDDRSTRLVFSLLKGQSCVVEGSPSDDVNCDGAGDFVAMARMSPDAKDKSALVAEFGQVIGTGESIERISQGPGRTAWYMSAVTLKVNAAGKLAECKPSFTWVGANSAKEQCDTAREDLFAPLEAGISNRQDRALTRFEAIYFRD